MRPHDTGPSSVDAGHWLPEFALGPRGMKPLLLPLLVLLLFFKPVI